MSHAIDEQPFPRGILMAAGALLAFVLAATAFARLTGIGVTHVEPATVIESRLLRFEPLPEGRIKVIDAKTNAEVAVLPPKGFGFVGVVLQGLGRERMRAGAGLDAPLKLNLLSNGRSAVEDPETGRSVMLDAFGHGNLVAFSQFFESQRTTP